MGERPLRRRAIWSCLWQYFGCGTRHGTGLAGVSHRRGAESDQLTLGGQLIMSVIAHEQALRGTTIGLRLVSDSGDEIDYRSGRDLTMAIEDSAIFTEGHAEGAVLATLSIDYVSGQNRVQVDSPRGQSDLVTIERTIGLLIAVRDALKMTTVGCGR